MWNFFHLSSPVWCFSFLLMKHTNHPFASFNPLSPPFIAITRQQQIHHSRPCRRHQQATNISNSIFKLNIVRFMHIKMFLHHHCLRAFFLHNISFARSLSLVEASEYLIINRIFPSFNSSFFFLCLSLIPFFSVWQNWMLRKKRRNEWNKWSFCSFFPSLSQNYKASIAIYVYLLYVWNFHSVFERL